MSLLGSFLKQPIETEIYSIQYIKDLTSTDELTAAWLILAPDVANAWDQVVQDAPYTALLSDAERILVVTSSVTLPVAPPENYRICVANKNQSGSIFVNAFNVSARGATVVAYKAGIWVEEATVDGTLVNALNDQRVRTRFSKGVPYEVYKVQVVVDTTEGRTLQDEFIVTIEEV